MQKFHIRWKTKTSKKLIVVNQVESEAFEYENFSDPEFLYNDNEFYSPISIVDKTYMCFLNNIVNDDNKENQLLSSEGPNETQIISR